jgi:alkylation response protein AidB-like acyl-CoA dehydrogenase
LQWSLADTAAELVTVRAATYQAAALVDAGYEARAESATAKAFASELAFRAADRTLQIFGGSGYCRDLPVEALFRAVRLWRIAEGTSEIQRMLVGRELDRGWRPGAVRIGTGQLEEVGAS